jgi:hypothetical protein
MSYLMMSDLREEKKSLLLLSVPFFFVFHFWHCPKSGAKGLGRPDRSAQAAGPRTTFFHYR